MEYPRYPREDIQLRFAMADSLNRMPYGDGRRIQRYIALRAWPPTGNCDNTILGAFRAMALANGGNRPEESLTTIERIKRDLDDSFNVSEDLLDESIFVKRRLRACPHCHGHGWKQQPKFPDFPLNCSIDEIAAVTFIERVKCDHKP